MIGQTPLLILVGVLLNATLIYSLVASLAAEGRAETLATVPRWIVPLLAGVLLAVLFPLERAVRRTSPSNQRDFTALIVGSSLVVSLPAVALGLSFVGLPLLDVHLSSAFSFVLLLYWAWRYRALFAGPVPHQLSRPYSLVLVLVAAWHLVSLAVRLLARDIVAETQTKTAISWYSGALFTIIAICCLLVAHLRRSRSVYSLPATTALAVFMAIDLPFGTAACIYWLLGIRKHEVGKPAA